MVWYGRVRLVGAVLTLPMLKKDVLAREFVRRGVGIGRVCHSIIMIAEFGGLVNGVVPVLQPNAVRSSPSG